MLNRRFNLTHTLAFGQPNMNKSQIDDLLHYTSNIVGASYSLIGEAELELEMKSPMNNHSAIRLIREFAISSQIIDTNSIGGDSYVNEYMDMGSLQFKSYKGEGSTRIRDTSNLNTPTDLYFSPTSSLSRDRTYDHKKRLFDISFNAEGHKFSHEASNVKFFKITASSEQQLDKVKATSSTFRRKIVRYNVGEGIARFLGFRCKNSITTIERVIISPKTWFTDSKNPYIVEMEWDGTDPLRHFIHDVNLLHKYIIQYHPMVRPEDISREDITRSTFFARGPYRVTAKNNGIRSFIFLQSDYIITMNPGSEQLNTPIHIDTKRRLPPDLDGTTIDVEVVRGGKGSKSIVLDVWHPTLNERVDEDGRVIAAATHEERIDWLKNYPQLELFGIIFKEFTNLDVDYHDKVVEAWKSVQDREELYDGIILQPQYRPFYPTANSSALPLIYRFKTHQSIDMNAKSFASMRHYKGSRYSYRFHIANNLDRHPDKRVVEYKVISAERREDRIIINLEAMRVRTDRVRGNQPRVIVKIIELVLNNITIDDLIGTQLDTVTIPDTGPFEVVQDLGIPITHQVPNGERVILFPDREYPWATDGRTVNIVTQSSLRAPHLNIISSIEELNINNAQVLSSWPLFPDSNAINAEELNSYIVVRVKLIMSSNYQLAGDNLTITYSVPHNMLVNTFIGAHTQVGFEDHNSPIKILDTLSIATLMKPIPTGIDREIESPYCPTWWAPTHGYPCYMVLNNFIIRSVIDDVEDEELMSNIVKYLSPLGMISFITLTTQVMEEFLDRVEEVFGLTATCQFLIPFLILMRYNLDIDIHMKYKGVSISSRVSALGVNLVESYSQDQAADINFKDLSLLKYNTDVLIHIPALYFFKRDATSYKTFSNVLKKHMAGKVNVYSTRDILVITPVLSSKGNMVTLVGDTIAQVLQYAYLSVKDDTGKNINAYLIDANNPMFLPEILYPELGLQDERPYLSVNWSHLNDSAQLNEKFYDLVDNHYSKLVVSKPATRTRSRRTKANRD